MSDERPTSVQLRDTQAALARVERERDEALEVRAAAIDTFINLSDQLTLTRAELASARQELDQLRAERAACLVTNCARCHAPIWCCQPREPMPGATGYFQHGLCPKERS